MGALPGGGVLTLRADGLTSWFDVDSFRSAGRRVVLRTVRHGILVLGSTQHPSIVDPSRLEAAGVGLTRRRSGGGAVLLEPGAQCWVDIWVPRDDPLWSPEPRRTAWRVGELWAAALAAQSSEAPSGTVTVHVGPPVPGPADGLVCFGGVGAGEVLVDGRKLVGLAQWRSREGALVHGCAYKRWDPGAITALLASGMEREALEAALAGRATGLDEAGVRDWGAERLLDALPDPQSWQIVQA